MPRLTVGRGLPAPDVFVQPWSTGASFIYLGLGSQRSPLFFGAAEGFPEHERTTRFMPVRNDISGRQLPIDLSFQGQDATLSLNMTVWDEGMATMLHRLPDIAGVGTPPGINDPGAWSFNDMGALMGLEGYSIPIWIRYPFARSRPSMNNLIDGYQYFQCIPTVMGTEEGAQHMARSFQFYIWPAVNFPRQALLLYNNDMSATLSVPINGPTVA